MFKFGLILFALLLNSCGPSGLESAQPNITAKLEWDLDLLNFDNTYLGDELEREIFLQNMGKVESEELIFGWEEMTEDFKMVSDDCTGKILQPEEKCSVKIMFKPSKKKDYKNSIQVGNSILSLNGRGMELPTLSLDWASSLIDFGTVELNSKKDLLLTLTNNSSIDLKNIQYNLDSEVFKQVNSNKCSNLSIGESCSFTVSFDSSTPGNFSENLTALYPGIESSTTLESFIETPVALLTYDNNDLDFGIVGVSLDKEMSVLVSNTGTAPTLNLGLSPSSSEHFQVSFNNCNILLPGDSCNISFKFKPNSSGPKTSSLILTDGARTINFSLSGSGIILNSAPFVDNQSFNVNEDETLSSTIEASDVNNDDLTYSLVSGPASGNFEFSNNGNFTYTPSENFNGVDSLTVKVNDGKEDSNIATISINVTAVNDSPKLLDDSYSVLEDSSMILDVLSNDSDNDGDNLVIVSSSGPSNGTLVINGDNTITYTPNINFTGSDSFQYTVSDGSLSQSATVSLTVSSVNDAPSMVNQSLSLDEDSSVSLDLSASDAENDTLNFSIVEQPLNGTVTLTGNSLNYVPNSNYFGSDSVKVKANDGSLDSNIVTISINVNSINDIPIISASDIVLDENSSVSLDLSAEDVETESSSLSWELVQSVSNGGLTGSLPNVTYSPSPYYNGSDSLIVRVSDSDGGSVEKTILLTVNSVNDAPIGSNLSLNVNEDDEVTFELEGSDVDGDDLDYTIVSSPENGSLEISGNVVTYTPNPDVDSTDYFTYQVSDGELISATYMVNIDILGVNDSPESQDEVVNLAQNSSKNISILAEDVDMGSAHFNDGNYYVNITQNPLNGSASIPSSLEVKYTPSTNWSGTDTIKFIVVDSSGAISPEYTITLNVSMSNISPVGENMYLTMDEESSYSGTLFGSDANLPAQSLSYILTSEPSTGNLSVNESTGSFTYESPMVSENSTISFSYKVRDSYGAESEEYVVEILIEDFKIRDNFINLAIDKNFVDGNLDDFPVLLDLDVVNSNHFWENVQSNGGDILILDSYGQRRPLELVSFNKNNRTGQIWVKLNVSSSSDTGIVLYYNNSTSQDVALLPRNDEFGSESVWSNNYIGVWHMDETSGESLDSSSNNLHMSTDGSVKKGNLSYLESFNYSQEFNLSNSLQEDSLNVADNSLMNISQGVTLEAFVFATNHNNDLRVVQKQESLNEPSYGLEVDDGKVKMRLKGSNLKSDNGISTNEWNYIVGSYNLNSDEFKVYINGYLNNTKVENRSIPMTSGPLEIGGVTGRSDRGFKGLIDEVRVSSVQREDSWVSTQNKMYKYQSSFWKQSGVPFSLKENFDRNNSVFVGNSWTGHEPAYESAGIENLKLKLRPQDGSYDIVMNKSFNNISSGVINFDYNFRVDRENEETYGIHVQLGDSSKMNSNYLTSGVGVNLKWSGVNGGMSNQSVWGYVLNGSSYSVAQSNKEYIKISVEVNLDSKKYRVRLKGQISDWIDFEDLSLSRVNSVRIMTDNVSSSNVKDIYFDNIHIY